MVTHSCPKVTYSDPKVTNHYQFSLKYTDV